MSWRLSVLLCVSLSACKSAVPLPPPKPLPPNVSFAGDWETNFGSVHLEQRDNWLFGTYSEKGAMFGAADGDQLHFNWRDNATGQWGKGYFVVSRDGLRMDGQYGLEGAETGAGLCWAKRSSPSTP